MDKFFLVTFWFGEQVKTIVEKIVSGNLGFLHLKRYNLNYCNIVFILWNVKKEKKSKWNSVTVMIPVLKRLFTAVFNTLVDLSEQWVMQCVLVKRPNENKAEEPAHNTNINR